LLPATGRQAEKLSGFYSFILHLQPGAGKRFHQPLTILQFLIF
jgi:hypothetical protein